MWIQDTFSFFKDYSDDYKEMVDLRVIYDYKSPAFYNTSRKWLVYMFAVNIIKILLLVLLKNNVDFLYLSNRTKRC